MVVGRRFVQRVAAAVVAVLIATLLAGAAYGAGLLGTLTQLSGTAGCFTSSGASEDGAGTCTQARGMSETESATLSPDGANVYVGSYGTSTVGAGFAVFSRNATTGALTQLSGKAGCLTTDGSSNAGAGTCTEARGLTDSSGDGHDLVFTSDGHWAYVAVYGSPSALLIFQRNPSTGALTQLSGSAGCIASDGSSQDGAGTCQTDPHLLQASGLTLSSDQRFLYATGTGGSQQIEVYSRNTTTGALSDIECISQAPAPSGCSTGRVVGDTQFIALSPDGMHAYAGQYAYGMSVFDRNPTTGLLTQKTGSAGCITDDGLDDTGASTCATGRVSRGTFALLVAPNGRTLYNGDGHIGLSTFHINTDGTLTQLSGTNGCTTIDGKDNTGASTCAVGRAISSPYGGVISPDGSTLYVSNSDSTAAGGLAVFSLDPTTGAATQLAGLKGCITSDGSSGQDGAPGLCTNGRALGFGYGMTISSDGRSVYQATDAQTIAGLAVYARETAPVCAAATAKTRFRHSVAVSLSCADADGDTVTRSIVSGPAHGKLSAVGSTGKVTYKPAKGFSGTDSFTFKASDGINAGAAATATITVGPRPKLSGLRVSPSKFSRKARISYRLNVSDKVTFTLTRNGHRVHGKIVKSGHAGANHFTFNGKFGGHALGPGTYRLIATPTNGKPKKKLFTIA